MKKLRPSIWAELSVGPNIAASLGLVLFFSLLVNILVLTSPLYMMQVYDRVLSSHQAETLVFLSIIAVLALVVYGALDVVRSFILARLGTYLDLTLRDQVLIQAIAQSRNGNGATRKLVDDLGTMRNFLGGTGVLPFVDAPWVPFFLVVMAMLHPWLGILGLVSAILLFGLAIANDRLTRKHLIAANAQQAIASEFANAAIVNSEVVHGMGMQGAISNLYGKLVRQMGSASLKAGDMGALLGSTSKALRVMVQSAALGLGAYLVISGKMSPGGMIAGSILLGRALAPIEQTIGAWRQFVLAREAYGKVRGFLSQIPFEDDRIALPDLAGRLSVEALSYQIPGTDKPAVRNVSFAIEPGTALALVGPSASGKSTLCRLLVGAAAPGLGNVRLDGADIISLNPDDARRHIGYLPQNVELFAGNVRDNIARLGEADDALVIAAAKAAGCHEMILRLADGYQTELGSRGMFLSGGQRQRIGLARAFYGNPSLLVLDEPNSNLDQDGEMALIKSISAAKAAGTTVVVVSHRSSLLAPIDKLGVMRDGILERFGNRDDVLREMNPQQNHPPKPSLAAVDGASKRPS